ncbi:hypothetical protein MMC28_006030, partial [Mycoblastus sanguinarius]|nr:hypothetical protein [Mycoblastus sanguinarius]
MASASDDSPNPNPTSPLDEHDIWAPQTEHANGHASTNNSHSGYSNGYSTLSSTGPDPAKSPSAISLRAFLLGLTLGTSLLLAFWLSYNSIALWRGPFFLATLSLFHFLEYYTTATFNPSSATVSAFLLSQNGKAYNIAHTLAFMECFTHYHWFSSSHILPEWLWMPYLILGFTMIVIGQATRTTAMAHAGNNFNHLVQSKKKVGHELVTDGIYARLRHPAYFGFFWWGLGTQVVLGNVVCLTGYAVVLWRFFSRRIK